MTKKTAIKKGIKPALLIIDVQNRYLPIVPERDRGFAIYFINLLIGLFHKRGFPIIRIYHHNKETGPIPNTKEFDYPDSITIKSEDLKIVKTYSDSFNKTDLDKILKESECNTLFICGFSAIGCVLATKVGAQNHDYNAFIVRDSIMSHNSDYTKNVEIMFDAISFDAVKLIVDNC